MDKPVPDVAIFQNSRTRQSAIWVKQAGHWIDADEPEYETLAYLANHWRTCETPQEIAEELARIALDRKETGEQSEGESKDD
tara:strand:- start:268 stop:513 length:246 start_codon:yes stop_codon:yes gene_type:complete